MAETSREMQILITAKDITKAGITSARQGFNTLAKGVGIVGAAVGGLGLGLMVKHTLEVADALAKTSDRLGISTKSLAGFHHAAGLTGGSTAGMNTNLQMMSRNLSDAAQGTGLAAGAIKALGLDAEELRRKGPEQAFIAIVGELENVESSIDKNNIAMDIFGRSGASVINMTAESLAAAVEEADALGLAMSRADAAKIEAANDAMLRMSGAMQGAVNTLTVELAPILGVLAEKITDLSRESGGFKDSIISFVEVGLTGVGYLGDAFRGWQLIFSSLELAWAGLSAGLLTGFETVDSAFTDMINNDINMINKLIEGMNLIPGVGVPLIQNIDKNQTLAGMAEQARIDLGLAGDAFWDLANEPLPSEKIKAFFEEVKTLADESANGVAQAATESIVAGGGDSVFAVTGEDEEETDKNAKLREEMAEKLEILLESQLGEQELLLMKYEAEQLLLNESREIGLIAEDEHFKAMLGIDEAYQKQKLSIEQTAEKNLAKTRLAGYKSQADMAKNAANIMGVIAQTVSMMADSGSKKDFETNKKVQMASAVVNTYAGATSALATYGGGPLGIAMAAITVAFGLAQLSKISSQSYEGGASGGAISASPPTMTFPEPQEVEVVEQPELVGPEAAAVNYHVEVHGNIMDSDATARALIEPLEQARLDGVESEL